MGKGGLRKKAVDVFGEEHVFFRGGDAVNTCTQGQVNTQTAPGIPVQFVLYKRSEGFFFIAFIRPKKQSVFGVPFQHFPDFSCAVVVEKIVGIAAVFRLVIVQQVIVQRLFFAGRKLQYLFVNRAVLPEVALVEIVEVIGPDKILQFATGKLEVEVWRIKIVYPVIEHHIQSGRVFNAETTMTKGVVKCGSGTYGKDTDFGFRRQVLLLSEGNLPEAKEQNGR